MELSLKIYEIIRKIDPTHKMFNGVTYSLVTEAKEDVLVKLLGNLSAYDSSKPLSTFVYACVHNRVIDICRKNSTKIRLNSTIRYSYVDEEDELLFHDNFDIFADNQEVEQEKELTDYIEKIISKSSTRNKEIFLLRIKGASLVELAEQYKITELNVRQIIFKTTKRVRDYYNKNNKLKLYVTS